MKKFAFVSRHTPTSEQLEVARQKGIVLVHVGDRDAFCIDPREFFPVGERYKEKWDGVVVVHPASAMSLLPHGPVGVFQNENRAPEGEPPHFVCGKLIIFRIFGDDYGCPRLDIDGQWQPDTLVGPVDPARP